MSEMYEACTFCGPSRAKGNFAAAKDCRDCGGKGFRRTNESFICNCCGEQMQRGYGLIDARVEGGYDSDYLWDTTSYTFSMCEKCLRDMFNGFKVEPKTCNSDIWDGHDLSESVYSLDRKAHERRLWERSDGQKARFGTGICNYEESCDKPAKWRELVSEKLQELSYCDDHNVERASNCMYLPESDLVGVALSANDRTHEQRIQLCDSIARHYYLGKVCFDKYLSPHFYELLGLPEGYSTASEPNDSYRGGIWFPNGWEFPFKEFPNELKLPSELNELKLPSGTLYWGKTTEIGRFERRFPSAGMNWLCRNDKEDSDE